MTKSPAQYDCIIVGQGLAGTNLAWALRAAEISFVIVAPDSKIGASHIAAGLVTPVTGKKLKAEPNFTALVREAQKHYREIESITGQRFYSQRGAVRLLREPREINAWETQSHELSEWLNECDTPTYAFATDAIAVEMSAAARLDVSAYLDASRKIFASEGVLIDAMISGEDVVLEGNHASLPSHAVSASNLIFARGYADHNNSWFSDVDWRAAKGQILTVKITNLDESRTVHGNGIWLTRINDSDHYYCGATYEWDELDEQPSDEATAVLCEKLSTLIQCEYSVIDQRAAVRPIVAGRKPIIRQSSQSKRVWLMNGLASKGVLHAPTLAQSIVSMLKATAKDTGDSKAELPQSGQ